MKKKSEQQILLWVMLLSSLIGLAIWYIKRLTAAPINEWGVETAAWLSYFTIFSNILAIIMAGTLLYGSGRMYDWFQSASVQSAFCLYIAFVGLGFWFLLGGPQNVASFLDWIPEITAHTLSPILGAIFWYRCVPKGQLQWRDALIWLAYPIVYLVYWLFHGPSVGYYPYFFIDVNAIGYSGVAMWSGALVVVFFLLGILMWRIDRWQAS